MLTKGYLINNLYSERGPIKCHCSCTLQMDQAWWWWHYGMYDVQHQIGQDTNRAIAFQDNYHGWISLAVIFHFPGELPWFGSTLKSKKVKFWSIQFGEAIVLQLLSCRYLERFGLLFLILLEPLRICVGFHTITFSKLDGVGPVNNRPSVSSFGIHWKIVKWRPNEDLICSPMKTKWRPFEGPKED